MTGGAAHRAPGRAAADLLLARALDELPESLQTGLERALDAYARAGAHADVALLISDANVELDELDRALRTLSGCSRTTCLVHLVAPDELKTTLRGPVELRDAESGRLLEAAITESAAAEYARRVARRDEHVRERCRTHGVRYLQARSDQEPLDLLLEHAGEVSLTVA